MLTQGAGAYVAPGHLTEDEGFTVCQTKAEFHAFSTLWLRSRWLSLVQVVVTVILLSWDRLFTMRSQHKDGLDT